MRSSKAATEQNASASEKESQVLKQQVCVVAFLFCALTKDK